MIEVVSSPGRIEEYNSLLRDRLTEKMIPLKDPHRLGWKGGGTESEVLYHPSSRLWAVFEDLETRHWNVFGLGDPREVSGLTIVVEINPPKKGIDRRMAGAFGVDEDGNAYLLHRGKVGGGREGIGKSSFLSTQGDYLREVIDGNRHTSVVVVSPLDSERLPNHIASFASQVRAYKEAAVSDPSGSDQGEEEGDEDSFSPEFEGTKKFSLQKSIEAQCSHGTVVRNLRQQLQEIGVKPANDRLRDLFLRNQEGKIRAVYEVKTSSDRQSVYSAIGQLIMYSPVAQQPKQVLVLPNDLNPELRVEVENRGFTVVLYEWEQGEATFPSPDRLLPSSGSGQI